MSHRDFGVGAPSLLGIHQVWPVGDALLAFSDVPPAQVWRSTDHGASWQVAGPLPEGALLSQWVAPSGAGFLASAAAGLLFSPDAAAAGPSMALQARPQLVTQSDALALVDTAGGRGERVGATLLLNAGARRRRGAEEVTRASPAPRRGRRPRLAAGGGAADQRPGGGPAPHRGARRRRGDCAAHHGGRR